MSFHYTTAMETLQSRVSWQHALSDLQAMTLLILSLIEGLNQVVPMHASTLMIPLMKVLLNASTVQVSVMCTKKLVILYHWLTSL